MCELCVVQAGQFASRDAVLGPEPPAGTRKRGLRLASQRNGNPDRRRTRGGNRVFGWQPRSDNSAKQEDQRRRRRDRPTNMNARAFTKVRTCPGKAHDGRRQAGHGRRQVMRDEQKTAAIQQRCREPPYRSAEERGGHCSALQGWCRHGRGCTERVHRRPCVCELPASMKRATRRANWMCFDLYVRQRPDAPLRHIQTSSTLAGQRAIRGGGHVGKH